jgi:hypothetical protein
MANVAIKISQLQPLTGSGITNDDFLPIVDSGSLKTYRIALGDIVALAQGGLASLLGGSNEQILYNQGGIVYGDNSLEFNYVSKSLQNGSGSQTFGLYSHAEGCQTFTSGVYAHSEGYQTYAYGLASHAGGYQTYAYGNYQTVVGQFNVKNPQNTSSLFIVGGGISDGARADLLLVDRTGLTVNGNINFSGSLNNNNSLYVPPSASYALSASYAQNGGSQFTSSQWINAGSNIYYSLGFVGINNPSPAYSIDVSGSINFTGNLLSGSTTYIPFNAISASFAPNQLTDISDVTGHKVGIGQTNPQYIHGLDVGGGIVGNSIGDMNLVSANSSMSGTSSYKANNINLEAGLGYNGTTSGSFTFYAGAQIQVQGGSAVTNSLGGNIILTTGKETSGTLGSQMNGMVGINTTTPKNMLDVIGNISCSVITASLNGNATSATTSSYMSGSLDYINVGIFISPLSSSVISQNTGSMFYSGSKLYIYTGIGTASGLSGWQTASLGG